MSSEIRPTLLLLSEWSISPQKQCRTNVFRRFFLLFALNDRIMANKALFNSGIIKISF